MKKFLLAISFLIGIGQANAQYENIHVSAQLGFPTGTFSNAFNLHFGLEGTYYFLDDVAEGLKIGATAGYNLYTASDDFFADFDFITLAASGRYEFTEEFFARLDMGFGIGLEDKSSGGFLFEPRVGYNLGKLDVFGYYKRISESIFAITSVGVGATYKF